MPWGAGEVMQDRFYFIANLCCDIRSPLGVFHFLSHLLSPLGVFYFLSHLLSPVQYARHDGTSPGVLEDTTRGRDSRMPGAHWL